MLCYDSRYNKRLLLSLTKERTERKIKKSLNAIGGQSKDCVVYVCGWVGRGVLSIPDQEERGA